MKPLLLNTFDQTGGAAKAAYRLLCSLRPQVAARMLVRHKSCADPDVIKAEPEWFGWGKGWLDILPLKAYPGRCPSTFTPAWVPDRLGHWVERLAPDLLHLHWVSDGFLRLETLRDIALPVVWTMHDSWPFTGGCHLPGACMAYQGCCGACPLLASKTPEDLSRRIWTRKQNSYVLERFTFVAPSHWLAGQARQSSLLGQAAIEVIPNGVDTRLYAPGNSLEARARLGLPEDRHLLLFGARHALSDHNKGADLLWQVLGRLPEEQRRKSSLLVVGEEACPESLPVDIDLIDCGVVEEESKMVDLYRAADLYVMTSRQENLPNMVTEAMSCGLPCAAFAVGGIPEQVRHRRTGCLADAYDADALSAEIVWLLTHKTERDALGGRARQRVQEHFALERVAEQYISLYDRALRSF